MERPKIKMPAGALIACILIVVFLLACLAGGILLVMSGGLPDLINNRSSSATPAPTSAAPDPTEPAATETVSESPDATPAPDNTNKPSSSLIIAGTQASPDTEKTEIIARCLEAVVSIDITMMNGSEDVYAGSGSGVIITQDGYIATCNHVVEGAAKVYVYLNDGTRYEAEIIGTDSVTDIAVIKLKADGKKFSCATLGSSSVLKAGESVYAIGNALGELSNTVTEGIISGLDRDIEIGGQRMTLLQTSAAINSGNSGGALFLSDGTLIGIVNAKSSGQTSSGATIEGLGFAVPIDLAKPIISDIMDYGFVTGRPYLGVTTKNVSYGMGMFSYYTYPQVISVLPGSPAEKAGIQENDVITAINGKAVNSSAELRVTINTFSIGETVTITIQRGNSSFDVNVTLLEKTSK
ncbi:MAG: trypsin-like peptidase domain-containing protein [Clostridia bacterium]|jgi:serine protease Do|nr:trypsin-like peptidase domain-containing protein [Clostridia bacterium]